jgi:hypothetical protein
MTTIDLTDAQIFDLTQLLEDEAEMYYHNSGEITAEALIDEARNLAPNIQVLAMHRPQLAFILAQVYDHTTWPPDIDRDETYTLLKQGT